MWHDIAVALCLVFVIEGMMPFISPGQWRKMVFNVVISEVGIPGFAKDQSSTTSY
jgi:uncharacterized protein YjeT (DUF2065 family)